MTNYTLQQLQDLEAAIASGTMSIEYTTPNGSTKTQFRSLREMEQLAERMRQQLGLSKKPGFGLAHLRHNRGTNR